MTVTAYAGSGVATGNPVVSYARAQVGKGYKLGAAGPDLFDCSGLAMRAYQQVGITLPHYSTAQALDPRGTAVDPSDPSAWLPGDLMFPHPGHVAIYAGGMSVIEATNPRQGVIQDAAQSSYWKVKRFMSPTSSASGTVLDQINQFLSSLGLSKSAQAGVDGNLYVESGLNPSAYNSREGAIGLAQWEGPRRTALESYAAQQGASETSLSAQLGYLGQEVQSRGLVAKLNAASSPAQAAYVWASGFEGNNPSSDPARESAATAFFAGQPPATGGVATAGFTTAPAGLLSGLGSDVKQLVMKGLFTIGGAALVIIGVTVAVRPQLAKSGLPMPLPI